jgi:predicted Zn-dependent protease with MMP-like domain
VKHQHVYVKSVPSRCLVSILTFFFFIYSCSTLWALSSLQYRPDDATLAALANAALAKISDFSSQHISNVVLSFAKMDHAIDPDILQALGREALAKLGTFTAQALSNTLWGLSKLGIADGDLFSSVAAAARATLPSFNSQNLAKYVHPVS